MRVRFFENVLEELAASLVGGHLKDFVAEDLQFLRLVGGLVVLLHGEGEEAFVLLDEDASLHHRHVRGRFANRSGPTASGASRSSGPRSLLLLI